MILFCVSGLALPLMRALVAGANVPGPDPLARVQGLHLKEDDDRESCSVVDSARAVARPCAMYRLGGKRNRLTMQALGEEALEVGPVRLTRAFGACLGALPTGIKSGFTLSGFLRKYPQIRPLLVRDRRGPRGGRRRVMDAGAPWTRRGRHGIGLNNHQGAAKPGDPQKAHAAVARAAPTPPTGPPVKRPDSKTAKTASSLSRHQPSLKLLGLPTMLEIIFRQLDDDGV